MLATIMFIMIGVHLNLDTWYWICCGIYGIAKVAKLLVFTLDD